MPDVNITINTPVLTAGKTFKVRYRLTPAGAWSAYQTKTNASFTLTGLADGYYELEVILVNADSSECPPTYKKFRVVTPFDCITFTASIVQTGSLYYLQINYTAPTGNPPCGWRVVYGGNVVNYPTLPAPPLKIQVPNQAIHLQVIANNCQLNQRACFEGEIPPMDLPPCVPAVWGTAVASFVGMQGSLYLFNITIPLTQSTPCSTKLTLQCYQINVIPPATGTTLQYLNYGFGPVQCTATGIAFQMPANPNVMKNGPLRHFEFYGSVIDECGKVHAFEVEAEHD
jgi:hypothetical protein